MVNAPVAFDGSLEELFTAYIEPNLPSNADVEHFHESLLGYCRQPDPVFVVRYVTGIERGTIYTTASGDRLKPSDNAPAWWIHFLTFNGIPGVDLGQMPTHMFEVGRCLPTQISAAGWHVAHILNAKDRNTDWRNWPRSDLVRRFIRNVHPCNCFYVPTTEWRRYGGEPDGRAASIITPGRQRSRSNIELGRSGPRRNDVERPDTQQHRSRVGIRAASSAMVAIGYRLRLGSADSQTGG